MDPEAYRNSLSSRFTPQDISALLSDPANLATGFALPTSFPSQLSGAAAAARSFGPLPGYAGHALHAADTHIQNFPSQVPYKSLSVSQAAFTDPYAALRGFPTQPGTAVSSKPMFTQEAALAAKETTFASAVNPSSTLDSSIQKAWGLSNFMSQNPAAQYLHPVDLANVDYASSITLTSPPALNPPPAHTSKATTPLQRNPFSGAEIFQRSTKSPPVQAVYDHRSQSATPVSSQSSAYSYSQAESYPSKSEPSIYSTTNSMNYEAVSPATPDQHSQQTETTYVSLQDLASISSTQQKLAVVPSSQPTIQKRPSPIIPDRQNKTHSKHKPLSHTLDMYNGQTNQLSHVKPGAAQQSPIGGSPQMQLGSQSIPSSAIVHAPPPVQAQADSTTKPKKPRKSRSKKEAVVQDMKMDTLVQQQQQQQQQQQGQFSPQTFTNSPDMSQRSTSSDMMSGQQRSTSSDMMSGQQISTSSDMMSGQQRSTSSDMMSGQQRSTSSDMMSGQQRSTSSDMMSGQQRSTSSDMMSGQQRSTSSDMMSGQPSYLQSGRSQPTLMLSSGSLTETHNSPLMASSLNQPFAKGQNQSNFVKSESVPNIVQQASPSPGLSSQQPQMMAGFQPAVTSQSVMTYSVSDALEMSREAVFPNQGMLEGYAGSEIPNFAMQESFSSQLSMARPMDLVDNNMRRPEMYNGHEEGVYVNNPYGGQFVSPNSVLNMDMGNNAQQPGQTTIDEAAFSSLMDESYARDGSPDKKFKGNGIEKLNYIPLTVKIEAEQDDDLSHLGQASVKTDNKPNVNPFGQSHGQPVEPTPPPPPPAAAPKMDIKNAGGGASFMDSYLNFIQGKKTETLSSMSSAIIHNKPQLPKYIPEPRRPRVVQPVETPKPVVKDTELAKSEQVSQRSFITFSDDDSNDESNNKTSSAVQNAITNLDNENDKVKISTNKSGGLTMKINLTKVKKAEENAKNKSRQKKSPKSRKKHRERSKSFGLKDPSKGDGASGDEEVEVIPARQTSTRKAKENLGRYKDSDSDSDTLKPIRKPGEESDEAYDSDRDPVWTPFDIDKKTPAHDAIDFDVKKKSKTKRSRSKPSVSRQSIDEPPAAKLAKTNVTPVVDLDSDSGSEIQQGSSSATTDPQVGEFVLDKKDLHNTETYAIWRIESDRMLHKYELFTENSRTLHRAIPTFSKWLPTMKNDYFRIMVNSVFKQGDKEYVQVIEQCRPKPALDTQSVDKHEGHPLVDAFNVYLQIFLSQAIEPGFLSAIGEANERFYLAPLEKIDAAINKQLAEIDSKVKWQTKFKECVKQRPHIRELDRPNLKQSCQACEFASQPAIKSVHLFGNPYERFTLQDLSTEGSQNAQEFMIGKTAAQYVKPYHNLYHFKYNLFKRCQAKVNILQDGSTGDTSATLDQCLQNRTWVLQIFEDLKRLLEKG